MFGRICLSKYPVWVCLRIWRSRRPCSWEIHVDEFSDGFSEFPQHEIDHLQGVMATDHLKDLKDIAMMSEWEKRYGNRS